MNSSSSRRTARPALLEFEVQCRDVADVDADVLVLKHAQGFYGADKRIADLLKLSDSLEIPPGKAVSCPGGARIRAQHVIFRGVVDLVSFDYQEIRKFGAQATSTVAEEFPQAETIALTIHGTGYGLDERESFLALLGGIFDSKHVGSIKRVLFVERDNARAQRLDRILKQATGRNSRVDEEPEIAANAGIATQNKPHVFVAMPFDPKLDDTFHFGINDPINSCGFLCERVDRDIFTGDVVERIKMKISSSSLVIADLTKANPNVFLEIGYAWGKDIPTLLVAPKGTQKLKFDVQTQRVFLYSSIKQLRDELQKSIPILAKRKQR